MELNRVLKRVRFCYPEIGEGTNRRVLRTRGRRGAVARSTSCASVPPLTHEVLREPAPGAPVHQHAAVAVHVRHVHGRALHLRVREPHLQVQVVHVLEELAKVPAGGPDRRVVTEVAEEPHEAPAEVPHEHVRCRLGIDGGRAHGRRRRRQRTVRPPARLLILIGVGEHLGRRGRQLGH